jgi:hypothetical protein
LIGSAASSIRFWHQFLTAAAAAEKIEMNGNGSSECKLFNKEETLLLPRG